LQSREAHDIRVFNAEGEAVAFALAAPPAAAVAERPDPRLPRLALFTTAAQHKASNAKGAVQVQLEQSQGGKRRVGAF
jgi:hypothetical protein